ncbi:probable helicase MAGATAMA 3 isoform X1 [Brassica napus]|uniref:probable helicase MAGATAMA 3 isoform X1 n=1 Tax=Brassica oleracea var. oleracea TaxID=109376 RepID=UPI0006A6C6BC|nr:PREDICTED: probable helicase MAGATAMA 3 isoform X1 [Brassica oleracea var. oleracea]XP_013606045.1 PREDICTED: probable helicase MAGATAMA 3 isoform X1 [Brassica oleracea var. oleracea]XP_013606053.1 PREDICTED: probable helicase MAGATAMA 3 isoform X1 [Brassica oleracea var. oleracea]XP_048601951.1 probable helicase MAGATAMA 3 isoform X1 [Brassica napus]XP_048601952.1 probable helicase MAGATAMA 3 isoform X1 [Brassica napus]XP_048601953.1 probable helicase MAGATAMA 3 isoform X1 [Brassica napus]
MAIDKGKFHEEEEAAAVARFHKIILGWDYKQLLKETEMKNKKDTKAKLSVVKNTYKDVDDYFETFEPLLFEEVKAQILQNQDPEEEAASGSELRLVMECSEADGFHILQVTDERERLEDDKVTKYKSLGPNDLLLLSKEEVKGSSFPSSYGFAIVENRLSSTSLRLRMYLAEEVVQITKKTKSSRTKPFIQSLSNIRSLITSSANLVDKRVHTLKLCGLSTIIREYTALRSICSLPFKDLIFTAAEKSCGYGDDAWKISGPLHDYFTENLNKSQKEAIDVGLSRRSFVLIQGPPGTGKTQTILSILGAVMHATPARVQSKEHELKRRVQMSIEEKYSHWALASPWILGVNPRDAIMPEDGDDGFFPTSGNDMKPEVVNANRKYRIRVLVCAPSNSALDEIVLRLLTTGLRDENAQTYAPKIVRIGVKPHHSVKSVWLDHLVAQRRGSAIDKPKQGTTGTDDDSIKTSILDEAAIVFSTLSFSGAPVLAKSNRGFDVVIIDEAAQAVEPATLIPLATRCKQVFLVGDPKQLPATVISTVAQDSGYGTSMFERLQKAGYPVNMLKTQYRMHPEIRSFPSKEFYEEALEDGADIEAQTTRDWHKYRCFGPFCFFDIHEGKESQHGATGSKVNMDEVEFVLLIYHRLVTMYPELKSSSQLAIISPYGYQVKTFKDRFKEMFGSESEAERVVDINTVDGFQGREKDVAIFSCVRANDKGGIGFLSNSRRMNVGITRAKSSVLVVGSAATLKSDPLWKNLVESAEKRNRLFKVSKPMIDFFSEENLETMKVTEDMDIPDGPGFEDEAPPVANFGRDDDNDFGDGDQDDAAFAEDD